MSERIRGALRNALYKSTYTLLYTLRENVLITELCVASCYYLT